MLVARDLIPKGSSGTVIAGEGVARVAKTVDGDTLILVDGTRVRLVQIDAPERGECYARPATQALARLVPRGTTPQLSADRQLELEDAYGRLLAYVEVGDRMINLELVREGAAVPFFFHGERGYLASDLLAAARDARRQGRGLWGACPNAKLDPRRGSLTGPG